MKKIIFLQQQLLQAAQPFGYEQHCSEILEGLMSSWVDEVWRDNAGNVICHKKGSGMKLVFSAHLDVIGFLVREIMPSGAVKLMPLGNHKLPELIHTPLRFESGAYGVIRKAGKQKNNIKDIDDLYVDMGVSSGAAAEQLVQVGDTAVFNLPCQMGTGTRILTPYVGDLMGCIALVLAARKIKDCKNDVYFIFTVGGEEDTSGATAAAWNMDPDICIAVNVTEASDEPISNEPRNIYLGRGASITVRDGNIHCPQIYEKLRCLAEENNIRYQVSAMPYGRTDAGSFQNNRKGAVTAALGIPTRGIHTALEICDAEDIKAVVALIIVACSSIFPTVG